MCENDKIYKCLILDSFKCLNTDEKLQKKINKILNKYETGCKTI